MVEELEKLVGRLVARDAVRLLGPESSGLDDRALALIPSQAVFRHP